MGIDAKILIKPKRAALLRGVIDPETDSVDVLDDGSLVLATFARFAAIEHDVEEGIAILSTYGSALVDAHDDTRGFLFFPDVCEPRGKTYEDVVREVERASVWVPARVFSEEEQNARAARMMAEVEKMVDASRAMQRGEAVDPALMAAMMPVVPNVEDAMARMRAAFERPEVLENIERMLTTGTAVVMVKRPSRTALGPSTLGENERFALADGTWVVSTTRAGHDAAEMVALSLGEECADWVAEHDDPRGVPVFMSPALDGIRDAQSYAEALARLGEAAQFVTPTNIDALVEQSRAKLRSLLARDD